MNVVGTTASVAFRPLRSGLAWRVASPPLVFHGLLRSRLFGVKTVIFITVCHQHQLPWEGFLFGYYEGGGGVCVCVCVFPYLQDVG